MKNNKCEHCGASISTDKTLCNRCDSMYLKLGAILQSQEVTKEEVEHAYKNLKINCD